MYSPKKIHVAAIAAASILVFTAGCSKTPVLEEKAAMNPQSTRLAVIAEGHDPDAFYFSEDGRHLAYILKQDSKTCLVLDGKESQKHNDISRVVFSPDCQRVAFRAVDEGQHRVVINGRSEKAWDSVGSIQFAPDGRVVYEARKNGKWLIVSGRRESPAFDMPFDMPMISADGKNMAYIEMHAASKKSNLVACTLDMKQRLKGKDYDAITRIKSSKTNSRIAYSVSNNGKQAVVTATFPKTGSLSEQEGQAFDQILTLDISDDGSHIAYLARRDKTVLLVKDGVELPFAEHEMRSQTLIAKDGRTFNAGMTKGQFFAVMDGKRYGKTYDGIKDPVFSPDGSQLAFVTRNGDKHRVVVNNNNGTEYDMVVGPQFSPDNSRLIYRARQDGRRFVVVADTKGNTMEEQPKYDMVLQPVITPDGKSIAYGVKTGKEFWWKVEPLK